MKYISIIKNNPIITILTITIIIEYFTGSYMFVFLYILLFVLAIKMFRESEVIKSLFSSTPNPKLINLTEKRGNEIVGTYSFKINKQLLLTKVVKTKKDVTITLYKIQGEGTNFLAELKSEPFFITAESVKDYVQKNFKA